MSKELDIRDISIIDALPVYDCPRVILNVGCGEGRIDRHLSAMGYRVYATDLQSRANWRDTPWLSFHAGADIFDLSSFPIQHSPIVLCSEVVEHLQDYPRAIENLIRLTEVRLIITTPFEKSFDDKSPAPRGHRNYWSDCARGACADVHEFERLCKPYVASISKIRTKPEDVPRKQWDYLIIVDKRQCQ